MGRYILASAILAAAAWGAAGPLWANSPKGSETARVANAAVGAAVAVARKKALANPAGTAMTARAPVAPSPARRELADPATDPAAATQDSRQPDTVLMLLASLGMLATVVFRVRKR